MGRLLCARLGRRKFACEDGPTRLAEATVRGAQWAVAVGAYTAAWCTRPRKASRREMGARYGHLRESVA